MNATTVANLFEAMHGEAFAYAKLSLYGDRARKQGHHELAELFDSAAKEERFEHFVEGAELSGLLRSEADNLLNTIAGESDGIERYREFAEKALAAGDDAAAAHFEACRQAEARRREAFKSALAKLEKNALRAW